MRGMRVEPPTIRMRSSWLGRTRGIVEGGGHGLHGAGKQLLEIVLEVGAGQLAGEMPRLTVHRSDMVHLDAHVRLIRKLDLGSLGRPSQPRLHQRVLAGAVDAQLALEMSVEALGDHRVEVVAAQLIVPGGRQHLDHAVFDRHHRDVEGPTAEVVDEDRALSLAAALVAEGGGGSAR